MFPAGSAPTIVAKMWQSKSENAANTDKIGNSSLWKGRGLALFFHSFSQLDDSPDRSLPR